MNKDQARQELARRELARRELSRREKPIDGTRSVPVTSNRFDTPYAKGLFTGGGQFIGGLSAGALATAAAPPTAGASLATVGPAAAVGGMAGGLAGDSLRQFLAKMTGGGPQSTQQQISELGEAGMSSALGEATLPALGAMGRPLVAGMRMGARHVYKNIPDPVLSWVKTRYSQGVDILNDKLYAAKDNVLDAVSKLGKAVKATKTNPELLEPPSPKTLYSVAEKAVNALDAVREQSVSAYGQAAEMAQEKPVRASLVTAGQFITKELKQRGLVNSRGQSVPQGPRGFTSDENLLIQAYEELRGMVPAPTEGLPEANAPGTFMNYQAGRRFLDRLEELLASAKTRNTQRILADVRDKVASGFTAADEGLAKQVPAYGQFASLRKVFESTFKDPDRTVQLLLSSSRDTKSSVRQQLEQLNTLAPKELKFLDDLTAFETRVAKAKLAKSSTDSVTRITNALRTPQQAEKIVKAIFDQPETTLRELEALEELSGIPFVEDFKDMAARQAFRAFRPSGLGYPTNAIAGALGYGAFGGPGAALGLMAGTAASTPAVQGQMLRGALPPMLAASRATAPLRSTARQFSPTVPPALSFLLQQQPKD